MLNFAEEIFFLLVHLRQIGHFFFRYIFIYLFETQFSFWVVYISEVYLSFGLWT